MVMATIGKSNIKTGWEKDKNYVLKKRLFEVIPEKKYSLRRKIACLRYTEKELEKLIKLFSEL